MLPVLAFCMMVNCREKVVTDSPNQLVAVKDSVQMMAESIAQNVSQNGPTEWLKVFENTPNFFMANDGQLAFANYDAASTFINNILIKSISKIVLHWSNVRIEPFTTDLASFSANYKETITDFAGHTTNFEGYFTSIAKHTNQGWKLHNVHWSSVPKIPNK